MTIELVDGKAGTAHISSEDKAIIHQAKFGAGDMVFEWGDAMSCTMQSANKAVIGTGCASIQGLDWHITNPETVTIQSGSSGKNRNDIICAHYHRETSTGVEKVELVAFKGVPSDAAAVDPTIPSAKILNGAADAYMPLWRIPLTGITAGTPVRLFNKRYALWDSVTLTKSNVNWDVNYRTAFVGGMLIVAFHAIRLNTDWNAAREWESSKLFTLPAGLEAAFEVHCAAVSNSSVGLHGIEVQAAGNEIVLRSSAKMTIGKGGWVEGCITVPL
ncbi:MAG: hypothetical protein ACLVJ9_06165 [Bifidobacterium catenulatum]|uniref:hypothetical protein n=1 Tax=Bifidobacterium pseudocatenulatum TaxID=28026 RepID=UPI0022DEC947|nr:hypothetical protein [Bifidobacterium pseudocatenulatum]MBS6745796.1 hypothetical protein [Bifidobacterium pseudocatenulatum]